MSDQTYKTNNGLLINIAGDYGDDEVEIHLADDAGEIVMWTQEEWVREPSLLAKISEVICCGFLHGPESLREQFNKPKPKPDDPDYEPSPRDAERTQMLDRDDIARAARMADAVTEEIGFEEFLAKNEIDAAGLSYVAEQRALRMCLIMEDRLGEINPPEPTPIELGWTRPLQAAFASAWMDAFIAGRLSRHDSSHDIPGIDPRPRKED